MRARARNERSFLLEHCREVILKVEAWVALQHRRRRARSDIPIPPSAASRRVPAHNRWASGPWLRSTCRLRCRVMASATDRRRSSSHPSLSIAIAARAPTRVKHSGLAVAPRSNEAEIVEERRNPQELFVEADPVVRSEYGAPDVRALRVDEDHGWGLLGAQPFRVAAGQ
jgi:hypothetical protein